MYSVITKVINKNEFKSKLFSKKEIKKIISVERIEDKEEIYDDYEKEEIMVIETIVDELPVLEEELDKVTVGD